ncbi:MAG TPA: hypothetical protein VHM30_10530 [Gemmatimonadaceae bacterium]|nr:hypothetical protein [Gemmatimonadaceae bacterium]
MNVNIWEMSHPEKRRLRIDDLPLAPHGLAHKIVTHIGVNTVESGFSLRASTCHAS